MTVANPALYVWLEGQQEREKGHPNAAGSPMGIPIRWEPGNRGKTPDRAVGCLGHLGHLTDLPVPPGGPLFILSLGCDVSGSAEPALVLYALGIEHLPRCSHNSSLV